VIQQAADVPRTALQFLMKGVLSVLRSMEFDVLKLEKCQDKIIERICSDPKMFEDDEWLDVFRSLPPPSQAARQNW
jgi:hypothetical protein